MNDHLIIDPDRRSPGRDTSERVLLRAPTGDDAGLVREILGRRRLDVVVLSDLTSLHREWESGADLLMIASESLNDAQWCSSLRELFDAQEPWSELPVLVLGGSGEEQAPQLTDLLGDRVQIVILERPLGIATFVSATEVALKSRRRQYEVKGLLDRLAAAAIEIRHAHTESNRAKDEFLATLAHELRSPMTAIRGWVEILKMGNPDAEMADALAMIESSTRVQAHIIEDLMDVSRIIAGKAMIELEVVDVGPVVRNIVATFRPVAELEGIELTTEVPSDPLFVNGDAVRLQQVGWNLLSNAMKFTERGGSVRVTLQRENDFAVIRVRDSGQGIAPELLPHVFERYRQEEEEGRGRQRGLGLGLAIVHHLVAGHGGTIDAFSGGRGKGAEFVISLPLVEPVAAFSSVSH